MSSCAATSSSIQFHQQHSSSPHHLPADSLTSSSCDPLKSSPSSVPVANGDAATTVADANHSLSPKLSSSPVTIKTEIEVMSDAGDLGGVADSKTAMATVAVSPAVVVNGYRTNVEDITDDDEPFDNKPELDSRFGVKTEVKSEVVEPGEGHLGSVKVEIKEEMDTDADTSMRPDDAKDNSGIKEETKSDEVGNETMESTASGTAAGSNVAGGGADESLVKSESDEHDNSSSSMHNDSASAADKSSLSVSDEPPGKKVWKASELKHALLPTLDKIYSLDPESVPFTQPVDPVALCIPVCCCVIS